jgi:trehalose synthase
VLHRVDLAPVSPDIYRSLVGDETTEKLVALGRRLQGLRVVHINATPYGGGVSELLRSAVLLLMGLGLPAEWQVISGDTRFFEVTKGLHNALQGARFTLSPEAEEIYRHNYAANARLFDGEYDVVVHDPQPAALRAFGAADERIWVWRCHIDTARPNPEVAAFLTPFLEYYDALVFTMDDFVLPSLRGRPIRLIPPGIDPLSPKNFKLPPDVCERILLWYGIDPSRPLMTQVSRFDPWKDPLGVIRVYRAARARVPGLQLALIGSMAHDDPEGWRLYEHVRAEVKDDPDVLVGTNLTGISNVEVNAFQRSSSVVIQKSLREGFGLVVSETLWKGTPLVAGRTGGITLQVPPEASACLVDPDDEDAFVDRVVWFLEHPEEARHLARLGREHVKQQFLITRMVVDELTLISELVAAWSGLDTPPRTEA